MGPQEFLDFINESEKSIKASQELEEAFLKKMEAELVEYVFNYYPQLQQHRKKYTNRLLKIAQTCAAEALECFGLVLSYQYENKPYFKKNENKKPQTKEESEKELQKLLSEIPLKYKNNAIKTHWEMFEEQQVYEYFIYNAHLKLKEIMVEFFFDDINEFEGGHLRMLDSYTYSLAIYPFIDECYEIIEPELLT